MKSNGQMEIVNTKLNEGIELYQSKKFYAAIHVFSSLLTNNPNDINAYIYRGLSYFAANHYGNAISDLTIAAKAVSDHIGVLRHLGLAHYYPEEYDKANKYFKLILQIGAPPSFYYNLATLFYERQQFNQAIKYLSSSLHKDSYSSHAVVNYHFRGNCYLKLGKYQDAKFDFTNAIKLDPIFKPAYESRIIVNKKLYVNADIIADYEKLMQLSPDSQSYHFDYALFCIENFSNHGVIINKAILHLDKVIKLNPTFSDAYHYRAYAKLSLNQLSQLVLDDCNKALEFDKKLFYRLTRATYYYKNSQYQEAINDCNYALNGNYKNYEIYLIRGSSHLMLGKIGEGLFDLLQAYELDPNQSHVCATLDNIFYNNSKSKIFLAIKKLPDRDAAFILLKILNQKTIIGQYFWRSEGLLIGLWEKDIASVLYGAYEYMFPCSTQYGLLKAVYEYYQHIINQKPVNQQGVRAANSLFNHSNSSSRATSSSALTMQSDDEPKWLNVVRGGTKP